MIDIERTATLKTERKGEEISPEVRKKIEEVILITCFQLFGFKPRIDILITSSGAKETFIVLQDVPMIYLSTVSACVYATLEALDLQPQLWTTLQIWVTRS